MHATRFDFLKSLAFGNFSLSDFLHRFPDETLEILIPLTSEKKKVEYIGRIKLLKKVKFYNKPVKSKEKVLERWGKMLDLPQLAPTCIHIPIF